ncbi:MAG: serine hydrolase [bacterium]
MRRVPVFIPVVCLFFLTGSCLSPERVQFTGIQKSPVLTGGNPWDVDLDFLALNRGYAEIRSALSDKAAPGAAILLAKDGKVIRRHAFGYARLYGERIQSDDTEPSYTKQHIRMLTTTVFDLASLTKMVATTTSILILMEQGKIDLDEPVFRYLPEFGEAGKERVTVRHLLTHTSGLPAGLDLYRLCDRPSKVFPMICDQELDAPPGYQRIYSDLGFIILGILVEEVAGQSLDRFARQNIFEPLGMRDTCFCPSPRMRLRCAATEYSSLHERFLVGEVHDENAYKMGGVAGHAGLFSTVDDLAVFCQMILNGGAYGNTRILRSDTVQLMLTPQLAPEILERGSGFLRGREQLIGWWQMGAKPEITSSGGLPSKSAFGHSGFTGTTIWIDPEQQLFAILLTNAVHPSRNTCDRGRVRRAFYGSVWRAMGIEPPEVAE